MDLSPAKGDRVLLSYNVYTKRMMGHLEQTLNERVELLLKQNHDSPQRRILIALAGAPGSGKSTISASFVTRWNSKNAEQIQVVPMDGFHYSQAVLSTLQSPECPFERRGAPFTFDAEGFVEIVKALQDAPVTDGESENAAIWVPSFDHAKKDPVERDICVASNQRIVLLEGNYLLLDVEPWKQIYDLVNERWFVSVPRDVAKERLIARHMASGIEKDAESAALRAEKNDLLNADFIIQHMLKPDLTIESK